MAGDAFVPPSDACAELLATAPSSVCDGELPTELDANEDGQLQPGELFVAPSGQASSSGGKSGVPWVWVAVGAGGGVACCCCVLLGVLFFRRKKKRGGGVKRPQLVKDLSWTQDTPGQQTGYKKGIARHVGATSHTSGRLNLSPGHSPGPRPKQTPPTWQAAGADPHATTLSVKTAELGPSAPRASWLSRSSRSGDGSGKGLTARSSSKGSSSRFSRHHLADSPDAGRRGSAKGTMHERSEGRRTSGAPLSPDERSLTHLQI